MAAAPYLYIVYRHKTYFESLINSIVYHDIISMTSFSRQCLCQGLVKGAILCFRNLYFHFQHGEGTSTASQLTSPASQKSKDLNKVPLLLQDLALHTYSLDLSAALTLKSFVKWHFNSLKIYVKNKKGK